LNVRPGAVGVIYKLAYAAAMQSFELSRKFPPEERYSLTDQVRRSSRSVCANLAEAWRKRRYRGAFISKLSDAEAEAAETQTWIRFAHSCGYLDDPTASQIIDFYNLVIGKIVRMITTPKPWLLKPPSE
jgi:four helix bundle protein